MKCLERNKRTIHYASLAGNTAKTNSLGQYTGAYEPTYSAATEYRANISESRGTAYADYFGTNLSYDKVIVTDDVNCPIDENSILWINAAVSESHDYVVVRKAVSLNSTLIAVRKVEGSN